MATSRRSFIQLVGLNGLAVAAAGLRDHSARTHARRHAAERRRWARPARGRPSSV